MWNLFLSSFSEYTDQHHDMLEEGIWNFLVDLLMVIIEDLKPFLALLFWTLGKRNAWFMVLYGRKCF
jgi:hypothetical protein